MRSLFTKSSEAAQVMCLSPERQYFWNREKTVGAACVVFCPFAADISTPALAGIKLNAGYRYRVDRLLSPRAFDRRCCDIPSVVFGLLAVKGNVADITKRMDIFRHMEGQYLKFGFVPFLSQLSNSFLHGHDLFNLYLVMNKSNTL
jgi:hypothetical protein